MYESGTGNIPFSYPLPPSHTLVCVEKFSKTVTLGVLSHVMSWGVCRGCVVCFVLERFFFCCALLGFFVPCVTTVHSLLSIGATARKFSNRHPSADAKRRDHT